ncbi:uncharacterized protein M437DRAFT_70647 [Aureobasidium melanogenum CBS 110374]|uniref:Uncharacterized protein n=1 Tax=Aureobasidium melanogenum (strain CBS 110374) TaxID=1043003 RepID=A0A074VBD9_AURM1|nr:uncharacterized protein M437DRAFT_70647 [Aureobasidium melanogenum CBS 110374]KEQ57628.1 hypothetical protein M437DRAFT_70647 [Aureobasidium melanogenum CBS 110374]
MEGTQARRLRLAWGLICWAAITMAQTDCIEGTCREADSSDEYLLCASQRWHVMSANGYSCVSGSLVPPLNTPAQVFSFSSAQPSDGTFVVAGSNLEAVQQSDVPLLTSRKLDGALGSSTTFSQADPTLLPTTWKSSRGSFGIKSYAIDGKMASVYDATQESTFRCTDIEYPSNGYYVAFWTQYDSTLISQPEPVNCGLYMNFTNPLTGVSASALVLDRCASCVGVGKQLNDPTTSQGLVNGATVDMSRALWNRIYSGAPGDVYDILYSGRPLLGMP